MKKIDLDVELNSGYNKTVKRDTTFNETVLIEANSNKVITKSSNLKHELNFEDCTFKKNVCFNIKTEQLRVKTLHINFNNCFILGRGNFIKNKITLDHENEIFLNYNNCILENINLDKLNLHSITIYNSVVQKNYLSISDSIVGNIQIHNLFGKFGIHRTIQAPINISYGNVHHNPVSKKISERMMELKKATKSIFEFQTKITTSEPKYLAVRFNNSSPYKLKDNQNSNYFPFRKIDFTKLDVTLSTATEKNTTEKIDLDSVYLKSFTLSNSSKADIEILRSKIDKIYFHDISYNSMKIYSLEPNKNIESVFEARNADFAHATFDKVDLSAYSLVSFFRSTLTNINFISPKFPAEIHVLENIHYPDDKEDNYFRMQSENYRQILKALISSASHIEALEIRSKMYSSLAKDKLLPKQDKIILCLNKISNNHGTSIKQPFFLFLVLNIFVFIIYRTSLNEAPYVLEWKGFSLLIEGVIQNIKFVFSDMKAMWVLINPTHKISTLENLEPKSELNSYSLFISYFSRILMAWIIYQFINSFRKYGKKL